MPRNLLGELETQLMLAILRQREEAYSATIVREIEKSANRIVAPTAVYIVLRRLEKRGLVSSKHVPPTGNEGGRGKRFFKVTKAGLKRLRETYGVIRKLSVGLEDLLT